MIRVIIFFAIVAAIAWGVARLADVPGTVTVNLQRPDLEVQVDLFFVIVGLLIIIPLLILLWSLLVRLVTIPSGISRLLLRRKEARGLEALSGGMIAVSSGNRYLAEKNSAAARKTLPNEPLTALLRAQTAQICGDRLTARRIYEGMLSSPDTELLGLRGLFLEAQKEKEYQAARQFAERAVRLDPKLAWAVNALFDYQCRNGDWEDALRTLETARQNSHVSKAEANRRRAVLLTAQAQSADEKGDLDRAVELAQQAHGLAPDLVPASEIAGRILASKGSTSRAAKILTKTWKLSPHPDLAYAFSYARPGDSPKDRLKRVQTLASLKPHSVEGPISEALAAIDAREWG
ncbi:MAG: heme biosynthesis protein HemY, partial [Desulfobulbia bacterium]